MNKIELFDGSYLYYAQGGFDKWCVYRVVNGKRQAPEDIDYFNELYNLSKIYNKEDLYNDYVIIYDLTNKVFDEKVIEKIKEISIKYNNYKNDIFRIFTTLYMTMISEENKKNTRLGKRIKRLGIYNLLIKGNNPEYCANFMKNMKWYHIDKLCKEGNF